MVKGLYIYKMILSREYHPFAIHMDGIVVPIPSLLKSFFPRYTCTVSQNPQLYIAIKKHM
jgi:hypothetical protein